LKGWRIKMSNMPKVKIGIVAVSRDCFPESLSVNRRKAVVEAYTKKYGDADIYECPVCIVESEIQMVEALEDIKKAGCNALAVYLGNFGPEIAETLLAKHFEGPKMFFAAAEERGDNLLDGRGDAYCGMLNASYNLKLRGVKAYIPEYPVGNAEECAEMLHEFVPIARAVVGLSSLKIISFGPRPLNFLACNAPIQQLYNLGVEIEENSELDLFEAFNAHEGDERIPEIVKEMEAELGAGNKKPEILSKLAQYELTLKDWVRDHKGYREYVAIAGKCWPAFQTQFGFVPCYVNSRLTAQGIPVSCEVDIYGALSEFIGTVVSEDTVTLLDINNTVPHDLYEEDIKPGDITFFRLQSTADCKLRAYIAQGEVLPVATRSFGAIGIFAIPEMGRFYRHVLIEKNFPHHGAVAFGNFGKTLYEVFKYVGVPVEEIGYNQPAGVRYPTENPWDKIGGLLCCILV
jgi:L-fucose isomerase-like protein